MRVAVVQRQAVGAVPAEVVLVAVPAEVVLEVGPVVVAPVAGPAVAAPAEVTVLRVLGVTSRCLRVNASPPVVTSISAPTPMRLVMPVR